MKPKIGAHVSAAGGLFRAIENAQRIGAEAIQLFGSSPRAWRATLPSAEQAKKFREAAEDAKIDSIYLHASYLVNLASANPYHREQSVLSLIDHLKIAGLVGARGLIFHLGSAGEDQDQAAAKKYTADAIRRIFKTVPGSAKLIMENSAGGGAKIGHALGEIGEIFKAADSSRLAVCFDTAHALEAGLIDQYSRSKIIKLFNEFEEHIGLKHLLVLHINDSKTAFASHHDRHENLGQGVIGINGFKNLAAEKRLAKADWILEVPGFDGLGPDKKNIEKLRSCFN